MKSAPAVLALVTDAFGGRGGIAQYNRDFLSALAEAGPEGAAVPSITILPRHAPDQAIWPTGIQQMPPRPGRFVYALTALPVAFTRRVDIVFCGHLYMAPLAMIIARLNHAKLVIQTHGIEAWPCPSWIRRRAVEAADVILCVSRYTRARVLSWAAVEPERVLVLPNTVRDTFTPGDRSELRVRWGLDGKQVLLTVGRMDARERYKGHDKVIQALPQLIAKGYDIHYVILGNGDDMERLKTLAVDLDAGNRVHFWGAADLDDLARAYRAADLFVMPSTGEGFGITFLEAMASGTPAVGLAVSGARDALGDGELGTAVTEPEIGSTIALLLDRPKPDPNKLSQAVRARYGHEPFRARACAAFERLNETAMTRSWLQ